MWTKNFKYNKSNTSTSSADAEIAPHVRTPHFPTPHSVQFGITRQYIRVGFGTQIAKTSTYPAIAGSHFLLHYVITNHQRCRYRQADVMPIASAWHAIHIMAGCANKKCASRDIALSVPRKYNNIIGLQSTGRIEASVIDREPDRPTRWIKEAVQGRPPIYESWWGQLSTESRLRPFSWCDS